MNAPAQPDMLIIEDDSSIAQRMICRVNSIAIKAAFPFIAEPTKTDAWRDCYGSLKTMAACITIRLDSVGGE